LWSSCSQWHFRLKTPPSLNDKAFVGNVEMRKDFLVLCRELWQENGHFYNPNTKVQLHFYITHI